MTPIYVFIAGPYDDDAPLNVREERTTDAMTAWHALQERGFIPYCPHLSHFLHEHKPKDRNAWLHQSLMWLRQCNAVYRLDGMSDGGDTECNYGNNVCGIPVFTDLTELTRAFFGRDK